MAKRNPITSPRERHGMSRSPEFVAWAHMRSRCNNPNSQYYFRYGGRGIKVCDAWNNSFSKFLEDMGRRPSPKHSIERIDLDGNYEAANCKWAIHREQMRNMSRNVRVTICGETKLLCEWAEISGVHATTIQGRINSGWPENRWLDAKRYQKINLNRKALTFNGETLSMQDMAAKYGIPVKSLSHRLRRGMPLEVALTQPRRSYPGFWKSGGLDQTG